MSEREGDAVREDLLRTISRLSDKYPQLRIAQLLGNAWAPAARAGTERLYYMEDSQLLRLLLGYEAEVGAATSRKVAPE